MFQVPRGTRDFTPEEMQKRRYLEHTMATTFTSFGYGEIQTPTFENQELFTAKSGESIINELYAFNDKGGRALALRPELTAPVIRCYVERLQMEPKPLKLYYFGNCYRYDRPQKGRYREFQQAGCELIGTDTHEATAELLALAYTILKNTGLKDIHLNIGNLTIISAIFRKLHLLKDDQKMILPLIDKSQFDDLQIALRDCNVSEEMITTFLDVLQTSDITKIRAFIGDDAEANTELSSLETILDLLRDAFHIPDYVIKLSIVRGLDYYKGLVFEIDAPALGAEKQLCGGGSYDLISLFGGTAVPTSGFAIGFDRTLLALEEEGFQFPTPKLDVFVIPVNPTMNNTVIQITQKLRSLGISADFDQLRRGIGKSLKYADAKHAEKVIIVGPKELENNTVTIRNMKTGAQEVVTLNDIYTKLQKS
ncbi:MAG: histidine--tRNA ligase [Candidatus Thermoplasmatota archaeon]|jgi:histidyl-tRNA synthetase|nr:histidine--tRNA ligase [Candidatus Thermoplasmatota archaeon]